MQHRCSFTLRLKHPLYICFMNVHHPPPPISLQVGGKQSECNGVGQRVRFSLITLFLCHSGSPPFSHVSADITEPRAAQTSRAALVTCNMAASLQVNLTLYFCSFLTIKTKCISFNSLHVNGSLKMLLTGLLILSFLWYFLHLTFAVTL